MRHALNSNHPDLSEKLWRGDEAISLGVLERCLERSIAKHTERPREAELCRFAFAGVMPTPSDRGRRLSAACRERVTVGLLRTLQQGELLETCYRRTEAGRLEWDITAFGKAQSALSLTRSAELALGWQAALHELRYGYRFAPKSCDASPGNRAHGIIVPLQACGRMCQARQCPP